MTNDELAMIRGRVNRAGEAKQRLDQAEQMLKAFQGTMACEPHEDVAHRLTNPPAAQAAVTGISFYASNQEYPVRWRHTTMPATVTQPLVEAFRALVRHLRTEYEAC